MAVTSFQLQAIISALDNASKVFGKVSAAAKKSGSGIKSAFKGAGTAFGTVRKGVQGVDKSLQTMGQQIPAMQAAFGALKGAMDLGRLGASFERVEERFGKFAEAAGGSESIFDAFQRGVGGTASKMDTMSISSGLLQAGLVGSAAEMEKVTTVASRLGDQTIGTADRIGAFSQLLKNQSIQLLDNFGISSGKVRERIGELQAETKGLSREQAFLTATFEQADAALAVLGPRTDDALASFERTDAQMADLRVEIGQKLAPAMADLMGTFSSGLSIVSSLVDVFGGLGGTVAELVSSVPVLGDAFEFAMGALDVETAKRTAEQLAILSDGSKVAEGTISEWGAASQEAMEQGASLEDVLSGLGDKFKETNQAFEEGGIVADLFVDQQGILNEALGATKEIVTGASDSFEEYNSAAQEFNSTASESPEQIEALNKQLKNLTIQQKAGIVSASAFERAEKDIVAEITALESAAAAGTGELALLTQAQFNMAKITLEGASANSLLADSIMQDKLAREQQLAGIELVTTEMERASPIWEASLRNQDRSNALQETAVSRGEAMGAAIEMVSQQAGASSDAQQMLAIRQEHIAGSAERAASAAQRLAESQAAAAATTAAFAAEQGNLMVQLSGATEEQFKQAVFAEIDPAAIGVEAYAALGVELGVLDEKAAGLAAAVPQLVAAYNEGIIPTENMAEVTTALFEATGNAETNVSTILDQFAVAPGLIGPSADKLGDLNERLVSTGEDSLAASGDIDELTASLVTLTAQPWVVDVTVNQPTSVGAGAANNTGIPSFQTGGVMPHTGLANLHAGEIILPPGQGTVTKNFNLTINTAAPMEPVLQDFATLEAMG